MEQIIKLTGRIAEVMPVVEGISERTGNPWKSQEYLFEYFEWSGATYPKRVVVRVFGHDRINQFNLAAMNGEVKLTISLNANQSQEGRWFNEVNVVNAEPVNGTQQPAQAAQLPAQPQIAAAEPANAPQPNNTRRVLNDPPQAPKTAKTTIYHSKTSQLWISLSI